MDFPGIAFCCVQLGSTFRLSVARITHPEWRAIWFFLHLVQRWICVKDSCTAKTQSFVVAERSVGVAAAW